MLVAAIAQGACQVDAGPTLGPDAGPCRPSPRFFVDSVWLPFVDQNQCATSECHSSGREGHGYLRFVPPGDPPAANVAFADWPDAWRQDYYQAIQLVRCDDPTKSRLLTVPEGKADPHQPGDVVMDHAAAEALFQEWVAAP